MLNQRPMKTKIPFTIVIFYSLLLTAQSALSQQLFSCEESFVNSRHVSDEIRNLYPELAATQAYKFNLKGSTILVQNRQVLDGLVESTQTEENGLPDVGVLADLINLLIGKDTFELPVRPDGFLPAANNEGHDGGYNDNEWWRDKARALVGAMSLPKLKDLLKLQGVDLAKPNYGEDRVEIQNMRRAMVRLLTEKEQFERILKNIVEPDWHRHGHANVPFIRQNIKPRSENRELTAEELHKESEWAHKQNDALALFGHSLLDGLKSNDLQPDQFDLEAKAQLLFLTSYFQRVDYHTMEDAGAWEELAGVRMSSIGLVTSFLERMKKGLDDPTSMTENESQFFRELALDLKSDELKALLAEKIAANRDFYGTSGDEAWSIFQSSFEHLAATLERAYDILLPSLGIHRFTEDGKTTYGRIQEVINSRRRNEDAAVLHVLLYPPARLTIDDQLHILNEIERTLMREAGISRYADDWFLLGNAYAVKFANDMPFPPDMIAAQLGDSFRASNQEIRDGIQTEFWNQEREKVMDKILEYIGTGLEAQWVFQDPMMAQIRVRLYRETGDRAHLEKAWFHIVRGLGAITGEGQITVEGHETAPFRAPEAWIPVRLIHDGQVFMTYFASPNSPLNWTIAENITALNLFMQALVDQD